MPYKDLRGRRGHQNCSIRMRSPKSETSNQKICGSTNAKVEAAGNICGDRLWIFCESKAVAITYHSLGTESRQIFDPRNPLYKSIRFPQKVCRILLIKCSTKNEYNLRSIHFSRTNTVKMRITGKI